MAFISEDITINGTVYTITDQTEAAKLRMMERLINKLEQLRLDK